MKIPIEVSARHLHLSRKDFEILFGKGYKLKIFKNLSQKGLFAAQETLTLKSPKNKFEKVRIIGPERKETQVEISLTDAYKLGLTPPLRTSGDIKGSRGIVLIGPWGRIKLSKGVIIARRHIHSSPQEAQKRNLKNGDIVSVKINGERGVIFNQVVVRTHLDFVWSMHIDTDEANAAGIINGEGQGEIINY